MYMWTCQYRKSRKYRKFKKIRRRIRSHRWVNTEYM